MVDVIPPNHVDDLPVVKSNQHDDIPIVPEHVLVDKDEDPEEEEFDEEKEPQEEEDDMEVDIKEVDNEPELTCPYEEVDPLNPQPPASESELEDVIKVEDTVESEDETVLASVHEVGESSTAPFLRKDSDGLLPGKAKDEYYGKLILDLGNEVRSSMEGGTAAMENLVKKLSNAEEKAECNKLKKKLEEARFSNTLLRMQNKRCQPMDHNIDFSGSDQIQTPQYPDVYENPLTNDEFEAFMKANGDKMNDLEIKFDHFQKQCEQMQDDLLNQMRNFIQNFQSGPPVAPILSTKEPENSLSMRYEHLSITSETESDEVTESNAKNLLPIPSECEDNPSISRPPPESPDDNFDLEPEFLCIHDDIFNLIESALDSKLLSIISKCLDKKEQEVKNIEEQPTERRNHAEKSLQNFRVIHKSSISLNSSQISSVHAVAPILSTKEPEHLLSMGYEHLSITPETESDEFTESNAKNLLPFPSECEVTLEDKRECDELICENSSTIDVCDNHSEILFDSNNADLSNDDESFEDIEYVDASIPDPAIVSVEEENVVHQEEEEVDLEEISQVQDVVLREKLLSITRLISNIKSLNENSTPDRALNSRV
nr:hypothetical protein [Tanacetum cinerariifolium]